MVRSRTAGMATIMVVAGAIAAWLSASEEARDVGTIPTGAGFSLAIPRTPSGAPLVAARLATSGFPAFARNLRRNAQVIVGPYVSLDEAEAAQRRLAARGIRAHMLVDESVRRLPGYDGVPPMSEAADVLLVSGAGRLSVVIELPSEPRQVFTRRETATALEVEAGPVPTPVSVRRWDMPAGVEVIEQVSIEDVGDGSHHSIRARVALADDARTNVRVVGRRIYIDVWSAVDENVGHSFTPRQAALPRGAGGGRYRMTRTAERVERAEPVALEEYRDVIAPAIARLEAMEPFVLSAVASPAPEVRAALAQSLRGLEGWIQTIDVPNEWVEPHNSLTTAVRLAIGTLEPQFTGDRVARAREAFALMKTVKPALQPVVVATN